MEKGIEFSERERLFVEKTLQTRAAEGVTHRIPRNAERIENGCRQVPARFGCLGRRQGTDDGSYDTNSFK